MSGNHERLSEFVETMAKKIPNTPTPTLKEALEYIDGELYKFRKITTELEVLKRLMEDAIAERK